MLAGWPSDGAEMTRAIAALLLVTTVSAAEAPGPSDVVQWAVSRVAAALEKSGRIGQGRVVGPNGLPVAPPLPERTRAEIRRTAVALFDFDEVARRALSRHWAERTPAEQAEFVALFTDLVEHAYVNRLELYVGEQMAITGEAIDGDYATVRSRITTRRGTEVALDYRLHLVNGRWRVYDVLVDGVSFVSTYRSELNRVIQSTSYDELLDRLRRRSLEVRLGPDRAQR